MSAPRVALCFVLTLAPVLIRAQDHPAAAPAATPAPQQMQRWIEVTDAPWQAAYKHEVTEGFDAEVAKLKVQYLTTLESALSKSSAAGKLEDAIALRDEKNRFLNTNALPAPGDAEPASPAKEIFAAARSELIRLKSDRSVRAKALYAKYDRVLAQAQAQLTQRERLDDALLVKTKREEIATAWLPRDPSEPRILSPAKVTTAPSTPSPATPPPATPASSLLK